jgi:mono/diheme cytochrome c family protein/glucose/arabinose dehydrogenase
MGADAPHLPNPSRAIPMIRRYFLAALTVISGIQAAPLLDPPAGGGRIVMLGNGLGERMLDHPYFEAILHLRYPEKNLVIRNMCRPGDTAGFRPHPSRPSPWAFPGADRFHPDKNGPGGNGHHPTPDQWLSEVKADTILAFFGYNESFAGEGGLANFKGELDAFISHTLAAKYNGSTAPKLVLVSPIAFEDLSAAHDLPDGKAENVNLALYTKAMAEVAAARQIPFVDLYEPTARLYPTLKSPFTRNGFLPAGEGYRQLANMLANAIYGPAPVKAKGKAADVLAALIDKNWYWTSDYRMLNGVHVDGQRYNPFGPANYPAEIAKVRAMTGVRDQAVWHAANAKPFDLAAADRATPPLPEIQSNYNPGTPDGQAKYLYGEEAVQSIRMAEGYKAELFASEKEFPNLANPVQIAFDDKGRLWVAVMPSYPHYRAGDPKPNDKLLIYEDTNGDGRADKEIVFADNLHLPIGFEFAPEGVYVSQQPHLILLRDTNGDDRADTREVVVTGFDSHDTHHAAGAFCADPSGAFMLAEGLFLRSNLETPYGPVHGVDGGFFRFSPHDQRLERTAQVNIPNPWGVAFDDWGQDFFLHTSGPSMNWMLPSSIKPRYAEKAPLTHDLIPGGHAVRPTSGLEFVSSSHFPDEVQGDFMLCNTIGFLGIRQHSIADDGTGYKTAFRHDLMQSNDKNFRPVDLEFAPDGSLYVADWHNVLIGHMQHNARDPLRDHVHGRIYRITYPSRPLVKPAKVHGAPVAELLENLKLPEYRTRYRSRRALRALPAGQVIPAIQAWAGKADTSDPRHEHHLLEALWATWGMNRVDAPLLRRLLHAADFRVRSAAVRVLRHTSHQVGDHADLLMAAAADPHGRVRLEAVIAGSWLDNAEGKKIVAAANTQPLDNWNRQAAHITRDRLAGIADAVVVENPVPPPPSHLDEEALKLFRAGHEVYFRDAHCVTCHQPDGKGLDPAFPPLDHSEWVTGDANRLIKLTLHGLMGPLEVNGKKYDGQVPMTPFAGILKDDEIAAVLTYVRNHFGNKASAITPEQVAEVRAATKDRAMFYQTDELLKEHPMEK